LSWLSNSGQMRVRLDCPLSAKSRHSSQFNARRSIHQIRLFVMANTAGPDGCP
jgi:hypothetical protein